MSKSTAAPLSQAQAEAGGGHGLLMALLAVAVVLAIMHPRAPQDWIGLVDWRTIGALAGLLAITQGIERSGILQVAGMRVLAHVTDLRTLGLLLTAGAAILSAMVTNDVSLFLLVPMTRILAGQAHLPLARLVVLEALAVNAGSALTPIGNPQNLYLWHRSGDSFFGFIGMMAPAATIMLFWVFAACWLLLPREPVTLKPATAASPVAPRLLWLSALLFVAFVVALDRDLLMPGLALVSGAYLLAQPRVLRDVDWTLLLVFVLMFVDLRQIADLPQVGALLRQWAIQDGWRAFLAAILLSQFISNVPATLLLDRHVTDLGALAAGVNVGGFGCVLGSLANLIALRLARIPNGLRHFHCISVPFLLVCTASVALLL